MLAIIWQVRTFSFIEALQCLQSSDDTFSGISAHPWWLLNPFLADDCILVHHNSFVFCFFLLVFWLFVTLFVLLLCRRRRLRWPHSSLDLSCPSKTYVSHLLNDIKSTEWWFLSPGAFFLLRNLKVKFQETLAGQATFLSFFFFFRKIWSV